MSNDVSLDINPESNPVQAVAPPKEDNNMLRATEKSQRFIADCPWRTPKKKAARMTRRTPSSISRSC